MMNIPSFAIVGTKKSGKTTIIEALISNFVKDGLKVVAIKNVHEGSLTSIPSLKDSWRLFQAGANLTIAISPYELELLKRINFEKKLEILFNFIQEEFDVVFLEGFKNLVLEREDIAKILVIKNAEEAHEFLKNSRNVIAITGELDKSSIENLNSFQIPIFNYKKDINGLINLVKKHYSKLSLIFKTMNELPLLNCGHCGYKNCFEFAKAIVDNIRLKDDCFILKQEEKVQVKILEKKLPLHPFVQDFIRKTVLGMLSSLKHVEIKGDEKVTIYINK